MSEKRRYTIAVDFDGVLHRYDTPFIDPVTIPDEPVEGAIEWLSEMVKKFDIAIFTTRAATGLGAAAVGRWLSRHGFEINPEYVHVTAVKPPALVYIDDRAWRFEGTFPTADEIHRAKPWHKLTDATEGSSEQVKSGGPSECNACDGTGRWKGPGRRRGSRVNVSCEVCGGTGRAPAEEGADDLG